MAYNGGFVVAVKNDKDEILRESNGKEVFLPFDSSYSLRLRNNNSRNAVAKVKIDGTDVMGGSTLIVPAFDSVDLESFCLDGDLNKGNKFLFVHADDERVQDPSSSENGKIEVTFTLERGYEFNLGIYIPNPYNPWDKYKPWDKYNSSQYWDNTIGGKTSSKLRSNISNESTFSHNVDCCSSSASFEDKGATIEGSISNQSFKYASIGPLDSSTETTIVLYLKPYKESITVKKTRNIYCAQCGRKSRRKDRFCPNCGERLIKI